MGRLRIAALFLLNVLGVSPANADIDVSEYELKSSIRSEAERRRMKALLEVEKKAEDERRRLEEEAEAKRRAEAKAAWDALPYAVRLTETRCTACHIADSYTKQRHNRIGWELVVLRMQHLNDVKLGKGERSIIAAHLAKTYPASGIDAFSEAMMQMLAILALPALWLASHGVRARRRRMVAPEKQNASFSGAAPASDGSSQNGKLERDGDDANHTR